MTRPSLQTEILAAFARSPEDTLSETMLRAVVVPEGGDVTEQRLREACLALADEGRLDFVRGGERRRYRLT